MVKRDEGKVVNLQRGTERQSYNCTPQCNPSITIGDEQKPISTPSATPPRTRSASPSAAGRGRCQPSRLALLSLPVRPRGEQGESFPVDFRSI